MILDEGRQLAQEFGVDIALVMGDNDKSYALAQHLRKTQSTDPWPELTERELTEARRLGGLARSGRLVPFMGAGVSVSAGAPTWRELIEQLAGLARLEPDVSVALLDPNRDALDQASFLRQVFSTRHPDDPQAFATAIASLTDLPRYGLAPALLAALDIEQAITLNYDTLFERAAADGGLPRRTIPSVQPERKVFDRWLLKLHGTTDDPATIVLTRSDYLGFHTDRAALSSIVKATLMTRHVLFVGFGMTDDHFHEIIHDVRRAVASTGSSMQGIGTVLTLHDDPLNRELHSELGFVSLAETGASENVPAAARRLEIFLDAMLAHASDSHSYLLDGTYGTALTPGERAMREQLERLIRETPPEARVTTSWKIVAQMLSDLGKGSADQGVADLDARMRVSSPRESRSTPDPVRSLAPNEVFVFGSNAHGRHAGGAARAALAFGAVWGEGDGLHGQSYAIDTMSGPLVLESRVEQFLAFASRHSDLTFLVTAIGCGTAGYTPQQVAPLFASAPDNVVLPATFGRVLGR